MRAIFENSLDGIVITEDRGICQEANSAAAALVGLSREEFIGTSLFKFAVEGFEEEWRNFRETGSGRARFWIRRHDGVKRLADCCFNANIMPGRHLCVLRDITEQQSLEEQLGQARKMEAVGRLAGGVAHDFNNILGIIGGYAELLELNSTDMGQRAKAEKILAATQKAASLTKQLLAFGRKQVMLPKLLDLAAVVAEVNSMVTVLVGAESQVIVRSQPDLGLVNADQGQLEQVILNLAANARDAMPNGGTLTMVMENHISRPNVSEVPPGEYVRFSVSDTGTGMDPEIESRIFEPFFTTKKSGTGLGLATVYGIVKQSGGYITVHSELDMGSTFNIYLPLITSPRLTPPLVEGKKRVNVEGSETILLVDDEDDLRNAAGEYLENCGYRVLKACNGKEAIEIADSFEGRIGLVISDIVMPKVNGRGVVDHMRKTRPESSILVISGYADDAIIRHGIFLETTCFLQKPFTFQMLGAKIRALLDPHA